MGRRELIATAVAGSFGIFVLILELERRCRRAGEGQEATGEQDQSHGSSDGRGPVSDSRPSDEASRAASASVGNASAAVHATLSIPAGSSGAATSSSTVGGSSASNCSGVLVGASDGSHNAVGANQLLLESVAQAYAAKQQRSSLSSRGALWDSLRLAPVADGQRLMHNGVNGNAMSVTDLADLPAGSAPAAAGQHNKVRLDQLFRYQDAHHSQQRQRLQRKLMQRNGGKATEAPADAEADAQDALQDSQNIEELLRELGEGPATPKGQQQPKARKAKRSGARTSPRVRAGARSARTASGSDQPPAVPALMAEMSPERSSEAASPLLSPPDSPLLALSDQNPRLPKLPAQAMSPTPKKSPKACEANEVPLQAEQLEVAPPEVSEEPLRLAPVAADKLIAAAANTAAKPPQASLAPDGNKCSGSTPREKHVRQELAVPDHVPLIELTPQPSSKAVAPDAASCRDFKLSDDIVRAPQPPIKPPPPLPVMTPIHSQIAAATSPRSPQKQIFDSTEATSPHHLASPKQVVETVPLKYRHVILGGPPPGPPPEPPEPSPEPPPAAPEVAAAVLCGVNGNDESVDFEEWPSEDASHCVQGFQVVANRKSRRKKGSREHSGSVDSNSSITSHASKVPVNTAGSREDAATGANLLGRAQMGTVRIPDSTVTPAAGGAPMNTLRVSVRRGLSVQESDNCKLDQAVQESAVDPASTDFSSDMAAHGQTISVIGGPVGSDKEGALAGVSLLSQPSTPATFSVESVTSVTDSAPGSSSIDSSTADLVAAEVTEPAEERIAAAAYGEIESQFTAHSNIVPDGNPAGYNNSRAVADVVEPFVHAEAGFAAPSQDDERLCPVGRVLNSPTCRRTENSSPFRRRKQLWADMSDDEEDFPSMQEMMEYSSPVSSTC